MRDKKLDGYKVKLVQVDLDGTLFRRSKSLKSFGKPYAKAIPFLTFLRQHGYTIEVFTARTNVKECEEMIRASIFRRFVKRVTNVKNRAMLYVDDRGYRFNGCWDKATKELMDIIQYHEELPTSVDEE